MFMKLWAYLTNQKIVYLQDFNGTITKTFAKQITKRGDYYAKRWWPFNIHNCVLLNGGKVFKITQSEYVYYWSFDKSKLPSPKPPNLSE